MATASAMGITTWKDPQKYGISLGLGAGEVRMIDMAQAYGTLANQGVKVPLKSIIEIKDYQGNILQADDREEIIKNLTTLTQEEETKTLGNLVRVLHRAPAYLISHILLDNNARINAFGPSSKLVIPNQVVSVKTGTTNDLRDNWTIGYTPELLTAVWVGNNDNSPMNRYLVSGVTGAAPIWNDIMSYILQDKEPNWPDRPPTVESKKVCALSGTAPIDNCPTRTEYIWTETQLATDVLNKKEIWVDKNTGLPLNPGDDLEGKDLELRTQTVISDPFTKEYCLDCVRPINESGQTQYQKYNVNLE